MAGAPAAEFQKVGPCHVRFRFSKPWLANKQVAQIINRIRGRRFFPQKGSWVFATGHLRGLGHRLKPYLTARDISFGNLAREEIAQFYSPVCPSQKSARVDNTDTRSYLARGARLYPFQVDGRNFLLARGSAILADEMGLGKSLEAISAVEKLAALGKVKKVLIFCPASIKLQWQREVLETFTTHSCVVIEGTKEKRAQLWAEDVFYYITNYENARTTDFRLMLSLWAWDVVILDEATRVKNWKAQQARRIADIAAPRWYLLTGTPIENNLEEFYQLLNFVAPWEEGMNPLGTPQQFRERFCRVDRWGAVVGYANVSQLKTLVKPFFLRRCKRDVLAQLPPVTEKWHVVDLDPRERGFYAALFYHLAARRAEELRAHRQYDNILADFARLRMCASHPLLIAEASDLGEFIASVGSILSQFRHDPETGKLRELAEVVRNLSTQDKGVIFATNVGMVHLIRTYLARMFGDICVVITGEERGTDRVAILDQFRADPTKRVLLATDALTYGANIQAASYVVNFDPPFNPAKIEQRKGRIERIGQQATHLHVVHLLGRDTIEMHVAEILRAKKWLIAQVLSERDTMAVNKLSVALVDELAQQVFGHPPPWKPPLSPTAPQSPGQFTDYLRELIPASYRSKTFVIPLDAIDIQVPEKNEGIISATFNPSDGARKWGVIVNLTSKRIAHNCEYLTPALKTQNCACPHLGAFLRKFGKVSAPGALSLAQSLVTQRGQWRFE